MIALFYLWLLPMVFERFLPLSDPLRILISLLLIAPLAFLMGLPFPLGLSRLRKLEPTLIPWAWAVNGCASVISAILATLLAIEIGFALLVGLAALLYLSAGFLFSPKNAK